MAKLTMTKVRAFVGALFAITLVIVFAAVLTNAMGMRLPILSQIGDALDL